MPASAIPAEIAAATSQVPGHLRLVPGQLARVDAVTSELAIEQPPRPGAGLPAVVGMAAAVQKQAGSASLAAFGSPGAIQRGATMSRFAMAGAVVPTRGRRMRRLMLFVLGFAAALVLVPSAAVADSAMHTYMLEMDGPNFG